MNYICPNCFERSSNFHYLCTNLRGQSPCTNAIEKTPIPANGKNPVCNVCNAKLVQKLCPTCGFELPKNIGVGKDYSIAVIGAKESGKTNYIAMLINELKNKVGNSFNCGVYATGGDRTTETYANEFYNPIFHHRECPSATDAGRINPLIYTLIFSKKKLFGGEVIDKAVATTFFDTAGENLKSEAQMNTYNRYLAYSSGIILLLDPLQLPKVRLEMEGKIRLPEKNTATTDILNRTISTIRALNGLDDLTKKIDIPIALAFTKIDAIESLIDPASSLHYDSSHTKAKAFDEDDFNTTNYEMQSFVEQWDGLELYNLLNSQFNKFAFFGLSALGSQPDDSFKIPQLKPIRVADPFLWLLWQNGIIPKK